MNQYIFREYDIRGLVETDLNEETVKTLARAIGTYYRQHDVKTAGVGYDARESSPVFCKLFIEEFNKLGINVLNIGMVPTPLLYYSLFTENVDAGVMITGSHNPAEYNGFKICLGKTTIHGEQIQEIKQIALTGEFDDAEIQGSVKEQNIVEGYIDFVTDNIKMGDRKLKIVVDAGNGIGGTVGVPLYKKLGCDVVELFVEPDSRFPNHHPDPTVIENMQDAVEAVLQNETDLAIAFDGDGDRIGVVDEQGKVLWGDELMMIFSRSILEKAPGATFIAEVKCSQRLYDDIEKRGGQAVMWKAGHSLIKAKMKETGAALAGEMSGHIFLQTAISDLTTPSIPARVCWKFYQTATCRFPNI